MRRDSRKNRKEFNDKILIYSVAGVAVLAVIVFALLMYSKTLNDDVKNSQLSSEQIASLTSNNTTNNVGGNVTDDITNDTANNTIDENVDNTASESASSSIGRTIEEQEAKENTLANNTATSNGSNTSNVSNSVSNSNSQTSSANQSNTTQNKTNTDTKTTQTNSQTEENEEDKDTLEFSMPVEGEITREFSNENLIYSETLQEWVTHMGIDIKADKTTIVKAAEEGTVKTIKNDPRYGLTIVIEHEDGFQTVYSNLLTAEFVVEGEKVKKGQTIGTVGTTAVFEIADEAHLHFEILKDSINVDPSLYIK